MNTAKTRIEPSPDDSIDLVRILTKAEPRRRKFDGILRLAALVTAVLLAGAANSLPAAQWQPIAEIEKTAATYIKSRIASGDVQAAPLDTRLRLPLCDQPLDPFLRPGTSIKARTSVGVRCSGSRP